MKLLPHISGANVSVNSKAKPNHSQLDIIHCQILPEDSEQKGLYFFILGWLGMSEITVDLATVEAWNAVWIADLPTSIEYSLLDVHDATFMTRNMVHVAL